MNGVKELFRDNRHMMIFQNRWHRVAALVFIVSWASMLIPMLLLPVSKSAAICTLALLGIGATAIFWLLGHAILYTFTRKENGVSVDLDGSQPKVLTLAYAITLYVGLDSRDGDSHAIAATKLAAATIGTRCRNPTVGATVIN